MTYLRQAIGFPFVLILLIAIASEVALADSTIFADNFTETTLNSAWQVLPGQGSYSVGGGRLQYVNGGPQASTTGWYNPALTLALPFSGTNWTLQTKATYNLQWLDGTGNSSGAQGPEVLVKFAPGSATSSYGGPNYAGSDYAVIERDIDACTGCNPANYLSASYGAVSNSNLINPADAGIPPTNNIGDGTYWYEITRDGGVLTVSYSYDGMNYTPAFSASLSDPPSSYNELLLGGITWEGVGSYTDYAYVDIASTATPEPGTLPMLLLASPLVVIGVLFRRRHRRDC